MERQKQEIRAWPDCKFWKYTHLGKKSSNFGSAKGVILDTNMCWS